MSSKVVMLLFKRRYWTVDESRDWVVDHGFRRDLSNSGKTFIKFKQADSKDFNSFATIKFKRSLYAVIGFP